MFLIKCIICNYKSLTFFKLKVNHLYLAAMLRCYFSTENTNACVFFFTSGSVNLDGSAGRMTKNKKGRWGKINKTNECLLVLAYKFKYLLFSTEKGKEGKTTWKYTMGTRQPLYVLIHLWKRRGKGDVFRWFNPTQCDTSWYIFWKIEPKSN